MSRVVQTVTGLVVVLLLGLHCGRGTSLKPSARRDAQSSARRDARTRPIPRRPQALRRLLAQVDRRATWFVAVGRPAALLEGAARVGRLLAHIPALTAPLSSVARGLGGLLGAWPPAPSSWRKLGLDPGGGLVVAGFAEGAKGRPEGTLVLVRSSAPQRLLAHLTDAKGPVTTWRRARLVGEGQWWCGPVSVGVGCASSRALLIDTAAGALASVDKSVVAELPVRRWSTVDLVGGWREAVGKPLTAAAVHFGPRGGRATVWIKHGTVGRWLGWLAPASTPSPRVRGALVWAWLRLDPTRASTVLGLLPKNAVTSAAPPSPSSLLAQCTGEASLAVSPARWQLRLRRKGVAVGKAQAWQLSGWTLWARAVAGAVVLSDSAQGTGGPGSIAPAVGAPRPQHTLLSQPASAALQLPLGDPLEHLAQSDRVRLVAALVGLAAGERALVGLARGLLTLLGELAVTIEKAPGGATIRLAFVSPMGDDTAPFQAFERLWRAKWQGGGYFDRQPLAAAAARYPGSALQALSRGVAGLQLSPAASRVATDWLVALLRLLRGPELSCAVLSARLQRCAEPFSRVRFPRQWRERETVVLGPHRKNMRRTLMEAGAREAAAIGAHCDRLGGRLENARAAAACLAADGCFRFSRCLVQAFSPVR